MNRTNQNQKGQAPTERSGRSGVFLVGPTASGKSAVAQLAAETCGREILSADSMLVYRGMDIGTDKPGAVERGGVRYHGIDLANPDEPFSVGLFLQRVASELRRTDAGRTEPLIVAGGTGLYISALLHGLEDVPPGDSEARARWESLLNEGGIAVLQDELNRRAPALLEGLDDKKNPRRLIRALELAEAGMLNPPASWARAGRKPNLVGLRREPEDLNSRIDRRVRVMFGEGLVEEVRSLLERYGSLARTAERAIGYAEAADLLAGKCTEDEAIEHTVLRTRRLAKRQRTWFAHQADVQWVEVRRGMDNESVVHEVMGQWGKHGEIELSV